MSPFYPPLPAPVPANPLGSALAGYGAVQDIQTGQSRNILAQMQLEKAQRGESALAEFGTSRDPKAFARTDPEKMFALQKAETDRMKPAMDYLYYMADQIEADPSLYPKVRAKAIEMGMPAEAFPDKYTPELGSQFKANYERMHKIQPNMVPIMRPDGTFTGQYAPKGTIQLKGQETPAEKEERAKRLASFKEGLTHGKLPSFADFVKDPEISKLSYPDQVAEFNKRIAGGKTAGKVEETPAKPLSDAELRQLENLSRREKRGTLTDSSKETLEYLRQRQSEVTGKTVPPQPGTQSFSAMPPAAAHKNKQLTSPDGKIFISNGTEWVEQK